MESGVYKGLVKETILPEMEKKLGLSPGSMLPWKVYTEGDIQMFRKHKLPGSSASKRAPRSLANQICALCHVSNTIRASRHDTMRLTRYLSIDTFAATICALRHAMCCRNCAGVHTFGGTELPVTEEFVHHGLQES